MKVSVIIPIFNASPFIDKAIKSVLNQPQTNQIILIDDMSTDDSALICSKWASENNKIIFQTNKVKKGSASARNLGLKLVTSDYIAFLDADDYFLPNRFTMEEEIFSKNPHIDGIARSIQIDNQLESNYIGLTHGLLIGPSQGFMRITPDNYIITGSFSLEGLTFKQKCLQRSGEFDTNLLQAYDQDFNIRIIIQNSIYSLNTDLPVAIYNIHQTNTIRNLKDRNKYRRLCKQKILKTSTTIKTSLSFKLYYLFQYVEYDYLCLVGDNFFPKKIGKIFLFPIIIFRLMFINK
jgi:glycosyltransferase involved in cell wall biosynthesis